MKTCSPSWIRLFTGLTAHAGVLFFIACSGGTGVGNPEFGTITVSLRAQGGTAQAASGAPSSSLGGLAKAAANDTLKLFDDDKTPYSIHHIYAHIDQIEFARPKESACRSSDSVVCTDTTVIIAVRRAVDLLERPSPRILSGFMLPLGVYARMKVRFSKLADSAAASLPAAYLPLAGHSILMKGNFTYGGVADRDLSIFLAPEEAFDFENAAGLIINRDLAYSWAGVFMAAQWLRHLEISECLVMNPASLKPDGSIVIDEQSNCNEYEDSLLENIRSSTSFEKDDDHE